jgi:cobalt-zinc-cadmium efflux system protein
MGDSAEQFPGQSRQSAETHRSQQPSEPTGPAQSKHPGQTDVGPDRIADQHEPTHHDHTHAHPVQNSRSAHGHHHGDHHHGHHYHLSKDHYHGLFALGLVLNISYIVIELVSGWLGNSLALIADAGHNVSDVLGLLLAWGAYHIGNWKPTERHTYGWRSASILAALGNAILLLVATGAILWEALHRLANPEQTGGLTVMVVAAMGVAVNGVTAGLFFADRKHDLNLRGAFLHMAADAGVSLAVVVAGAAIWLTGWTWFDPVASLIVALIILWSTWDLARESIHLSLQAVPWQIELAAVRSYLESLPGVTRVHDLHIWAMSTTENALTAHLVKPILTDEDRFLAEVSHTLLDRFGIVHTTIQIERDPAKCQQACAETPS